MEDYIMTTPRLGFRVWSMDKLPLAQKLWGDPDVCRYISHKNSFTEEQILARLKKEISNLERLGIQYWPMYSLDGDIFAGVCGLKPNPDEPELYEIGLHMLKPFWGGGYGLEASRRVLSYAFDTLKTDKVFAGHHPDNIASKKLLEKLGFQYAGMEFYEPTEEYHPFYFLYAPTKNCEKI